MNKDLERINKHVERSIDLFNHLQKQLEERRVDSTESEWYNKGRADAYGFAILQVDDIRVHINSLREINNEIGSTSV